MNLASMTPATARRAAHLLIAGILAVFFLLPLVYAVLGSVTGRRADGTVGFTARHYERLLHYGFGLDTYLTNTTIVVLLTVVISVFVAVLGGYAFARFNFPSKTLLFVAALAILMVPHATLLIPLYVVLGETGLRNSLVGLSLVLVMFQLPFSLFMMRNSFDAIPRELDEAALVDGCSSFQAMRMVLLPAVMPGVITVALFAFLTGWNEFIAALILLNDGQLFTLPVALVSIQQGDWGIIDFGALQAGVVVSAIPCLILFLLLQRAYISGFTAGAVRG
jgi:multiple sugar transport system permease protein